MLGYLEDVLELELLKVGPPVLAGYGVSKKGIHVRSLISHFQHSSRILTNFLI